MSKLQVEYRPIKSLIPYARNARTHSSAQVDEICASIREFGWTNPVLIAEDDGIIAGHGRVLAAERLGMDEVPCIRLTGLSEAQRSAYILADNKLALNAGWDDELLRAELSELKLTGFELTLTGFSPGELDKIFGNEHETRSGGIDPPPIENQYGVIVMCMSEPDQERIYNELRANGYNCKVVVT